MHDQELIRYSKHILLDEIDIVGQTNIMQSRVLIVGCGGLGNIVATYLASNGVGEIVLMDDDKVELSNLPRQIGFNQNDIDCSKADVLQRKLQILNPNILISTIKQRLSVDNIRNILSGFSMVLDCTDGIVIKKLINRTAQELNIQHIFASASNFIGYFAVFDFKQQNSPCLSCLFPEDTNIGDSCLDSGVFSPLVALVGILMVNETLKILGQFGEVTNLFWKIDSKHLAFKSFKMNTDPECPICQSK